MRRLPLVAAAGLVATLVVAAPVSLARYTASDTTTGSATTGAIAAPSSLAASRSAGTVTLTWTPTVTTTATGYDVLRSATSGSGYSVVSTVTPRTAATTTNSPGNGTWYYVLQASYQNWRSPSSNEASISIGSTSTGFKTCATDAADTGGDGDGYETNAANGCVQDGSVATDSTSGTNSSTSCADAGKDRHRFAGYAFGLPGSVSSIDGISVQLTADLNNNGGTTVMCVQLSWDGGTSWTATKSVSPSNSMTTFTLGGATDLWGHSPWTLAQLDPTQFRVRVIDVSSMSNKDFYLDGLGVQVTYTP